MNLENYKINGYASSVTALPDYPSDAGITAQQLKAVFDARSDGEIKNQHNALVDFIGERLDEIFEEIAGKVDSVPGKGLSTNDFTEDYRTMVINADATATGAENDIMVHMEDSDNPHKVTARQIGLDNVDNTRDLDKNVAFAISAEMDLLGNVIHEHYATKDEVGDVDLSEYVPREEFTLRVEPIENDINNIYDEIGDIDTALDSILAIQNELMGG